MARVLTNLVTLQVCQETSVGVLPGSPSWDLLEPNSIGKFGPMLKKVTREPISKNRQPRKPALVDLDSTVDFEHDITYSAVQVFVEGLFFSVLKGTAAFVNRGVTPTLTAVTATGYTVTAGGALPQNTLILARGFGTAANNGLKTVGAASIGTEIKTAGLTAEAAPPVGASVEVAGRQGAVGDLQIDASGNLTSTLLDFTTLGLQVGQWIWVGDIAGGANSFANANDRGLARIRIIAAGKLTLDKRSANYAADTGATKLINVYFGRFVKNVASDSADYLERSFQFELVYKNLQNPGPGDEYEYAAGNYLSELAFNLPLTGKGTMKCSFIGTTTANPATVRATGAATPTVPVATFPVNTSTDLMRLRVTNTDETGVSTDFKSLTCTIKNQVTAEKVLGTLGGKYMNVGQLDVEITASLLFTSSDVIKAMRDNRQVTMEFCCRNDDGGFLVDLPALTIEGGDKGFPMNQTVTIAMKAQVFQDPTLGDCVSMSTFPYMPSA